MPEDDYELDAYQLYTRYEDTPPKEDWRKAALRGPALPTIGNAVAGAVGAAASNLVTYPLSLIITRLQTQKQRKRRTDDGNTKGRKQAVEKEDEEEEKYAGVMDAARKIYAREGLSSFYTGLAQDTVKTVLDAFLFFLAYEYFRQRRIAARYGPWRRSKHTVLPVLDELAVGVLAGAFAKLFTTPLSNIVARKQTSGASASSTDIVSKIRSEKGLRGFWSGYSASLILTLNPSITFFLNGMLKYALLRRNKREKPSPAVTFLLAAVSKSAASSIIYPFSMAKTRSQISGAGSQSGNGRTKASQGEDSNGSFLMPSIISNVITIARIEGVSELYAGLRGEVLKGFFSHGFTMLAKDAVYAAIVRSYYLLLIATRQYPSPEELLERARERAEEYAEAAREGAKNLAEKAKSGTEEILDSNTGNMAVDMTSNTHPVDVGAVGSNETAEMVGDYVEDEASEWRSLYHWFWEKENSPLIVSTILPYSFAMSTEPHGGPGLGDLEKELACSICTDLLFQPLTLLDCLHTFCGSCLKEWFYTQGSRRPSSSSARFTCPSCRANVRETRPNATVTTLLDMVLTANPERAKPAAERVEIEQRYKHGQSVFPPLESPGNSAGESDEEDRRILEEVRQLSLEDPRSRTRTVANRTQQSSRTRRTDSADFNGQREEGRRRRREEERTARRQRAAATGRVEDATERTRRVEHQSSLRSLLSLSDTETMEEEILRQIFEEGLLDDIDLDNLEPGQEEELSERIADAYRRRHMLRSRSQLRQNAPEQSQAEVQRPAHTRSQSQQRPQEVPSSPSAASPSLLEPPVSRPGPSNHQRRLSEQGYNRRRRTSPMPQNPASSSDVTLGPAVRSSSDIIPDRPRNSHSRSQPTGYASPRSRRANYSGQRVPNILIDSDRNRASSHTRTRSTIDSPRVTTSAGRSSLDNSNSMRPRNGASELSTNSSVVSQVNGPARQEPRPRPSSSRSNALIQPANSFTEPSISCDRCGKAEIQYDLYKSCPQCKDGNYHLCLRCYRLGRGCLEWKGFGASAQAEFEKTKAPSDDQPVQLQEFQHILQTFRYSRPFETALRFVRDGKQMTTDNPAHRLQQGLFCDRCQLSANDGLWRCNICNEGDWGFCHRCVNQGKCCTHPLLPICRIGPGSPMNRDQSSGDNSEEIFKVLTISTKCDICTCLIPTSTLRFHCLRCNDGDYDVCANCYLKLVATSKIRKEDGLNGWRRCLKGHRIVVIGFEDYPEGQRRVIARNLVGGYALNDDHLPPTSSPTQTVPNSAGLPSPDSPSAVGDWSWKEGPERRKKAPRIRSSWNTERDRDRTNSNPSTPPSLNPGQPQSPSAAPSGSRRFPPDGGVGLVVNAMWSWIPEEVVHDELMFPRGAEITEAENINEDWYWGCYAGMKGLFPGSHVSVVGEIV
ncbi:hypothetical protein BDW59DRAFT_170130 [Aspergillus cavernicola]|uniref:RING-type domain-containing protein n=1 Tax=Aspergillus cavernicola TaxID=176166 RepID=A0ABR4ISC7_9EURO